MLDSTHHRTVIMAGRQRRVAAHGATQVALTDNAVAQLRLEPLTTADSPVVLQIIELLRCMKGNMLYPISLASRLCEYV